MSCMPLIIYLLLSLTSCGGKNEQPRSETPPVPVLTAPVVVKDIPFYVESIGTLQPSVFIEIRPEVGGMITKILVKEGQDVVQDSALIALDAKATQIKLQEMRAQLSLNQSSLQSIQKKLERFRSLSQKDLISKIEWDDLEAQLDKTKALIQADEARLAAINLELDRCSLKAPCKGRIGKINIHPGSLVSALQPTPLLTLSDMDPLKVEFTLNEKDYKILAPEHKKFEISLLTDENTKQSGEITFTDNHFDSKSGLILVQGLVPNPARMLRPGQYVRVNIPVGFKLKVKLIPQKAVKYNQQGPFVFIVQPDNTVGFRSVKTGEESGNQVVIVEGLEEQDIVITDGHLKLAPGLKVEMKS